MTIALDGSVHGNATAASVAVALTTSISGDRVVVFVTTNGGPVTSISDTAGNTWHFRAASAGSGNVIEEWYADVSGTLSADLITVNVTSSAFTTVDAFGVSGSNLTFDGSAVTSTGPDPISITTTNAHTIALGGFRTNITSAGAGAGFTSISSVDFQTAEYKVLTTAQTLSLTLGAGAGGASGCIADAIVEASVVVFRGSTLSMMGVG